MARGRHLEQGADIIKPHHAETPTKAQCDQPNHEAGIIRNSDLPSTVGLSLKIRRIVSRRSVVSPAATAVPCFPEKEQSQDRENASSHNLTCGNFACCEAQVPEITDKRYNVSTPSPLSLAGNRSEAGSDGGASVTPREPVVTLLTQEQTGHGGGTRTVTYRMNRWLAIIRPQILK